jgi:hypothetical protein
MTDYKATPEQWENMKDCAADNFDDGYAACILELRAKVEALEANSESPPNSPHIGSLLAKRVHLAIYTEYARSKGVGHLEARAAIREVAAWLREKYDGDLVAATVLEREAKR